MSTEAIGFLLLFAGIPLSILLGWLNVRWRLAQLPIPIGVLSGGLLLNGLIASIPPWVEIAFWIWFAAGMYAVLLLIGYIRKPFMEDTGQRWSRRASPRCLCLHRLCPELRLVRRMSRSS